MTVPAEPSYNEQELLQRLLSGDTAAFTALYELYAPSLTGYVAARLSSLEEARDIIHDLFVYIWEERANMVITHSLRAYLFAAARYRIIDHIRRHARRREYAGRLASLQALVDKDAANALEAKDLQGALDNAVNELPPRVREIYRLSRDRHRSIAEIAGELNISPQTVKNQLTTALSHLRSILHKIPFFCW